MLSTVRAYGFPVDPLELPLDSESSPIQIKDIQGIGPVKANIITTPLNQGEILNATSVGKRNIVFVLGLNPNWVDQTPESLRALLYDYFMPQLEVRLRFESTHMPEVEIRGYVEGCEQNIFTSDPEYQVSIICPEPDFIGVTERTHTGSTRLFGSVDPPAHIDYNGSVAAGFRAIITKTGFGADYEGPFLLRTNPPANDFNFLGRLDAARSIELSTQRGSRYIRNLIQNSEPKNLLSSVTQSTVWPTLRKGDNEIWVYTNSEPQQYQIKYYERFGGI